MNFKMKLGWNRPENLLVICVKLENVSVCSYSVNSVSLVGDYYVLMLICCLRGHLFLALYKWDKYSHFEVSWWLLMNKFYFVRLCYEMECRFGINSKLKRKSFEDFTEFYSKNPMWCFLCVLQNLSLYRASLRMPVYWVNPVLPASGWLLWLLWCSGGSHE